MSDSSAHTQAEPLWLRILLVGEGNLSFSYALVKKLSKSKHVARIRTPQPLGHKDDNRTTTNTKSGEYMCSVMVTSFDSHESLISKYPEAVPFLNYFATKSRLRVDYRGGINATILERSDLAAGVEPYNLVIFNNPHVGFEDLYRQRSLLSHFFSSVRALPEKPMDLPMQVVVALCDTQPQRWGLLQAAARGGFICVAATPVLSSEFPEYTNKRHQSDSNFPYKWMVQYYFMKHEDCRSLANQLHSVLQEYFFSNPRESKDWLSIFTHFYPDLSIGDAATKVGEQKMPSLPTRRAFAVNHDFTNGGATSSPPFPLLHPRLVFHGDSNDAQGDYLPYLSMRELPLAYQTQLAIEAHTPPVSRNTFPPATPPQFDEQVLGRPLTSREQVKYKRYLAKSAGKSDNQSLAESQQQLTSHQCTLCSPSRFFARASDLEQHTISRHSGIDHLHPNMHARVHNQIIAGGTKEECAVSSDIAHLMEHDLIIDSSDAAVGNTEGNTYCRICDLCFKTADMYKEHLRFLSPHDDSVFQCTSCSPPRQFTDIRALVQHNSLKHTGDNCDDRAPSRHCIKK